VLALLFAVIDEGAVPHMQQLARLRNRLHALMAEQNRAALPTIVPSPRLEVPIRTSGAVGALIARLRPLLCKTRSLFSIVADEGEHHRVAPYELFQRDGHIYLDAVMHATYRCATASTAVCWSRPIWWISCVSASLAWPRSIAGLKLTQRMLQSNS
jgi:hypothetical protein